MNLIEKVAAWAGRSWICREAPDAEFHPEFDNVRKYRGRPRGRGGMTATKGAFGKSRGNKLWARMLQRKDKVVE